MRIDLFYTLWIVMILFFLSPFAIWNYEFPFHYSGFIKLGLLGMVFYTVALIYRACIKLTATYYIPYFIFTLMGIFEVYCVYNINLEEGTIYVVARWLLVISSALVTLLALRCALAAFAFRNSTEIPLPYEVEGADSSDDSAGNTSK